MYIIYYNTLEKHHWIEQFDSFDLCTWSDFVHADTISIGTSDAELRGNDFIKWAKKERIKSLLFWIKSTFKIIVLMLQMICFKGNTENDISRETLVNKKHALYIFIW